MEKLGVVFMFIQCFSSKMLTRGGRRLWLGKNSLNRFKINLSNTLLIELRRLLDENLKGPSDLCWALE
jgi:hypothetical protein